MRFNYSGLEAKLEAAGMSKSSLVRRAHVTSNVVVAISKKERISMDAALSLCRYFCCDFNDIITLEYEQSDWAEFKLSVFREMFENREEPEADDIKVLYETKNDRFLFYYKGVEFVMYVNDGFRAFSRAELIEHYTSLIDSIVRSAVSYKGQTRSASPYIH